jgi:hypothetical protein
MIMCELLSRVHYTMHIWKVIHWEKVQIGMIFACVKLVNLETSCYQLQLLQNMH